MATAIHSDALLTRCTTKTKSDEMEIIVNYYPIAVLQKILLPIQGLFNFLIYIRPRFMLLRRQFPDEGRLSTLKRIFQGPQLPPKPVKGQKIGATLEITPNQQHDVAQNGDAAVGDTNNLDSNATPDRMPRYMMSSITASDGDFDALADELLGDDQRWHDVSSHVNHHGTTSDPASGVKRISALGVISELSQSVFELTPYQVNGSHLAVVSDRVSLPSEPSESRWKGSETSHTSVTAQESERSLGVDSRPEAPTRRGTVDASTLSTSVKETERSLGVDSKPEAPTRCFISPIGVPRRTVDASSLSDAPIRLPIRTSDTANDCSAMSDSVSSRANTPNDPPVKMKGRRNDVPLTLPERFHSLPPSEIEDV